MGSIEWSLNKTIVDKSISMLLFQHYHFFKDRPLLLYAGTCVNKVDLPHPFSYQFAIIIITGPSIPGWHGKHTKKKWERNKVSMSVQCIQCDADKELAHTLTHTYTYDAVNQWIDACWCLMCMCTLLSQRNVKQSSWPYTTILTS